jgi:hypothetical protein
MDVRGFALAKGGREEGRREEGGRRNKEGGRRKEEGGRKKLGEIAHFSRERSGNF